MNGLKDVLKTKQGLIKKTEYTKSEDLDWNKWKYRSERNKIRNKEGIVRMDTTEI